MALEVCLRDAFA
ncbi:hypothetical protein FXF05_20045 [Vibrio mimicus]|nr:hypothetical protein FXF05_20045 [Vibrio mimicus]